MTIAAVVSGAARWHVEAADCFDFAARIPAGAVSLLWLDGPYWMDKAAWDTFPDEGTFLAFYRRLFVEAARILAPNGSLYVCTSTAMAARLEVTVAERFEVLNCIRWAKGATQDSAGIHRRQEKDSLRSFFPASEAIIFAEQFGADGKAMGASGYSGACDEARGFVFEPLRAYLDGERERAGWSVRRVAEEYQKITGSRTVTGMAGHWFGAVQWALPTAANYEWMRRLFNRTPDGAGEYLRRDYEDLRRDYEDLRRDYEDLRRDYEDLRRDYEDLRRPFTVSAAVPYTDTWTYATVPTQSGKHPCEKPPDMLRDVIAASSRPGDLVCELFAGSGVGGEQAILAGRRYLGCDSDPEWARRGAARVARAERDPHRAGKPFTTAPAPQRQLGLFG